MVVTHATPILLHEFKRLLPQLPTANPTTVRDEDVVAVTEVGDVDDRAVDVMKHAFNLVRTTIADRPPFAPDPEDAAPSATTFALAQGTYAHSPEESAEGSGRLDSSPS
jgi:hypothetical protein